MIERVVKKLSLKHRVTIDRIYRLFLVLGRADLESNLVLYLRNIREILYCTRIVAIVPYKHKLS